MTRDQAVTTWREVCGSDTVMAFGVTGRMLEEFATRIEAAGRDHNAGWFALVMNAAAALEDAANCLRDPDAKRAAEGAAKHYRAAASAMWEECDA